MKNFLLICPPVKILGPPSGIFIQISNGWTKFHFFAVCPRLPLFKTPKLTKLLLFLLSILLTYFKSEWILPTHVTGFFQRNRSHLINGQPITEVGHDTQNCTRLASSCHLKAAYHLRITFFHFSLSHTTKPDSISKPIPYSEFAALIPLYFICIISAHVTCHLQFNVPGHHWHAWTIHLQIHFSTLFPLQKSVQKHWQFWPIFHGHCVVWCLRVRRKKIEDIHSRWSYGGTSSFI